MNKIQTIVNLAEKTLRTGAISEDDLTMLCKHIKKKYSQKSDNNIYNTEITYGEITFRLQGTIDTVYSRRFLDEMPEIFREYEICNDEESCDYYNNYLRDLKNILTQHAFVQLMTLLGRSGTFSLDLDEIKDHNRKRATKLVIGKNKLQKVFPEANGSIISKLKIDIDHLLSKYKSEIKVVKKFRNEIIAHANRRRVHMTFPSDWDNRNFSLHEMILPKSFSLGKIAIFCLKLQEILSEACDEIDWLNYEKNPSFASDYVSNDDGTEPTYGG